MTVLDYLAAAYWTPEAYVTVAHHRAQPRLLQALTSKVIIAVSTVLPVIVRK